MAHAAHTPNAPTPSRRGCLARLVWAAVLGLGLGAVAGGIGWFWLDATLPDVFSFEAYRTIAKESSRVHAADGSVVAQFGEEIRSVVPFERIPKPMLAALVCAEDAAFYDHPGLDVLGIARALWKDVVQRRAAQGASTITQQFAKTRFLSREKTISRKLKELVLARKLESKLSKDEILALYANEVYFGHGRYGVEEAARFFFGKPVAEIDVAEAAMLAGIVNSPARFSPLRHPEEARQRRSYVLQQMRKRNYLTDDDLARAEAVPLPTRGHDDLKPIGPYYMEAVRRFVLGKVERGQLANGGLRIEVALDPVVQAAADAAVFAGLQRIDKKQEVAKPLKHYATDAELQEGLRKLTDSQGGGRPPLGRVLLGVVRGALDGGKGWRVDLGGVEGTLAQAALRRYGEPKFKPGDLLRVSVRDRGEGRLVLAPEFGPQAAVVAIEPGTGLVRALAGGDDFALHPFDRASQAKRQPGSTFKTFTYGAAIEAGQVSADTQLVDEAHAWPVGGRTWTPRNFSGTYDGKSYSVRDALAFSINSIAVAVAAKVGPAQVAAFAHKAGVHSELDERLPLALGASSVSPLELAEAYATLAAGGRHAEPVLVTRIVGRDGKVLWQARRDDAQQVIAEPVTRQLTDMMGEVVRKGSGKEASKVGRQVAGKTGTSNGGRDVWFAGFTAELLAVVWVGHDDRKPMPKATGGTLAVPIWVDFMRAALDRVPPRPLPRLPHVVAGALVPVLPAVAGDPEQGTIDDAVLEDPKPAAPLPELPPLAKPREDD
jgi:penicillin-binding protein 1A